MTPEGLMKSREQKVRFTKRMKDGETVTHTARIVTYVDLNKRTPRLVSLLTNNMEMRCHEIIAIYRKRWEIELLFRLLKQDFPLRYFYGESANAIKIQIWVTLIANLLLMVIQKRVKRTWSFSGLATMVRIMLMYYVNCYTFLENPEKDWAMMLEEARGGCLPNLHCSTKGLTWGKYVCNKFLSASWIGFYTILIFSGY